MKKSWIMRTTAPVALAGVLALAAAWPTRAAAMMGGDVPGLGTANFYTASFAEGGAFGDPDYRAGQKELDAGNYEAAARAFAKLAGRGGEGSDAARYWQAYAESKAGRRAEALGLLERLRSEHPQSSWLDDARALEQELRGSKGAEVEPGDDEELKLYALNALMHSDSERAVATLERFLAGNHSRRLLEQALFVLSQSDAPRARQVLAQVARGQGQGARPELRRKAIETLGIAGDEQSTRLLAEIYASAADTETKAAVLNAFLISGEEEQVLAAARNERDPTLRGKAIGVLGAMGADRQLREMYQAESATAVKLQILDALFVAGDVETLGKVATADPDPQMRLKAIHGLGVSDARETGALLTTLYRGGDAATKRAVIEALFIQSSAKALLEIARTETDRALRREALQRLSLMDEPEALEFLLKQLED